MLRLPICGGNWNNGANAGVFNVNLNNPRSNANGNIGFRSALPSKSDAAHLMGMQSVPRCKGSYFRCSCKKTGCLQCRFLWAQNAESKII